MAILLPETGLDEAVMLARKLCDQIRETVFDGSQHEALRVTTSIGVATYTKAHRSPEGMLRACDEALYRAKENGRDRVEAACG
jgi:diguanylate cyclase (GGDEF)-like protein